MMISTAFENVNMFLWNTVFDIHVLDICTWKIFHYNIYFFIFTVIINIWIAQERQYVLSEKCIWCPHVLTWMARNQSFIKFGWLEDRAIVGMLWFVLILLGGKYRQNTIILEIQTKGNKAWKLINRDQEGPW